jgi:hypothetical protein
MLEARLALGAAGRRTGGLDRRQEQPHQHADDADHDQQLDERKTAPSVNLAVHDAVTLHMTVCKRRWREGADSVRSGPWLI